MFVEVHRATIGADFSAKIVEMEDGRRVKLQVWDTAGAAHYRTITKMYYRGAKVVLLLVDLTDRESLAEVGTWVDGLNETVPLDVPKLLVGCKCDLVAERQVEFDIAHDCAQANGMEYVEVSAREDVNVDLVFMRAAEAVRRYEEGAQEEDGNSKGG